MTEEEFAWMQKLAPAVDMHWNEITDWEKHFAEDILERCRIYGRRTNVSPKQWEIITRISEKVL